MRLCKAKYWEPCEGSILIRPTLAKSAMTKASKGSVLGRPIKDYL